MLNDDQADDDQPAAYSAEGARIEVRLSHPATPPPPRSQRHRGALWVIVETARVLGCAVQTVHLSPRRTLVVITISARS